MRLHGLCLEIVGSLFFGDERHDSLTVLACSPLSKSYTASYLSSIAPLDIYSLDLQSSEVGEVWKSTWSEINQGEKYRVSDRYRVAVGKMAAIVVGENDMPHILPLLTMTGVTYLKDNGE